MTDATDGGYYAIKGFLYQFDRTLIEIFENPDRAVAFENRQDIDHDDYVLQVKHKETQEFKPSKIAKAVDQLISLFVATPTLKPVLYCHFKDRAAKDWSLGEGDFDSILGKRASKYSPQERKAFVGAFVVRFSEDFDAQFANLLVRIKTTLSIRTDEEAILYHSLFRSHLLALSVRTKRLRHCSLDDLKALKDSSANLVFGSVYSKHLGAEKYEKMLRTRFFTFGAPNIENIERLFVVEPQARVAHADVLAYASNLSRKYFRCGKSPQPYLCLRGLQGRTLDEVKQGMVDQGIRFFDGTHFHGDRFRLNELVTNRIHEKSLCIKLVPEGAVNDLLRHVGFPSVFQFYARAPLTLNPGKNCVTFAVSDLAQAMRVIK